MYPDNNQPYQPNPGASPPPNGPYDPQAQPGPPPGMPPNGPYDPQMQPGPPPETMPFDPQAQPGMAPGTVPFDPYAQPGQAPGMPPTGTFDPQFQPVPPESGKNTPMIAGAAAGAVALLLIIVAFVSGSDDDGGAVNPTGGTDTAAGADTGVDANDDPAVTETPSETEPDPIAEATVGDCFYDYGTEDEADLEPSTTCDPGTFEVVDVFQGTTDLGACDGVDRLTSSVSYPPGDMVLCLSYIYGSGDGYHAEPGECVFGTEDYQDDWYILDCQTGAFEVLERIPGESDSDECEQSTYYNHAIWFTTSQTYLDVLLCLSMIYPDDLGYASVDDCMEMTEDGSDRYFYFADCDSANVYITGRTNEYNDSGFCGNHGWQTWQSSDFPEHAYTLCWNWL